MGKRRRAKGRRSHRDERGEGSFVLPLLLLIAVLAAGWSSTPADRRPSWHLSFERLLGRDARAEPVPEVWVDPAALSFASLAEGVGFGPLDPRWLQELEAAADAVAPFRLGGAEEDAGCAELSMRLAELSFVRRVPLVRADEQRGLVVDLDLAEPVACVPVGSSFLCVDRDGVLLSGTWPTPPCVQGMPLPVIGPMRDAYDLFAAALPGDWLEESAHLDALDVALSMREHLERAERIELGRVVIDASRARIASVEEPGIRLLLENGRLVLFGRRPSTDEPGELPVELKWASVERALELDGAADGLALGSEPAFDWSVLDVRWDRPEIVPRFDPATAVAAAFDLGR
ncbi:MAG TPA: hypothetical protein ENJ09_05625 [Planctomycetes bacterium]|nr:hypothetical protein [Planctomycetota bacterium]